MRQNDDGEAPGPDVLDEAFPWLASEPSTHPEAAERATWTAIARRVDWG